MFAEFFQLFFTFFKVGLFTFGGGYGMIPVITDEMLSHGWMTETEILKNTVLFLHVSCYFFPILGLLCILRYTIQGAGYTNLAMLSGVSEMIARTLVSIYAVPIFGFLAVCFGDPTAWIAADLFLVPAFIYVYRKLKKSLKENYAIPNSSTSNSSVE